MSEPANIGKLGPAVMRPDRGAGGRKGARAEAGFAALVKPARADPVDRRGAGLEGRQAIQGWSRSLFAISASSSVRTPPARPGMDDEAIGRVDIGLEFPPLDGAPSDDDVDLAPLEEGAPAEDEDERDAPAALPIPLPVERRPGGPLAEGVSVEPGRSQPVAGADAAARVEADTVGMESSNRAVVAGGMVDVHVAGEAPVAAQVRVAPVPSRAAAVASRADTALAGSGKGAAEPVQAQAPASARGAGVEAATAAPDMLVAGSSASADPAGADSRGAGDRRRGADVPLPKLGIVSEQTLPAPAAPPAMTSVALATAIAGEPGWQAALRTVASLQLAPGQMQPGPLHSMTLQLHPAELGAVTANLQFVGDRLTVEIVVENRDAFHRLNAETDAVMSTLKGLGYSVDQVSVIQSTVVSSGQSRSDPGAGGGLPRDGHAAGTGDGGERTGGRGSSADRGSQGREAHAGDQADRARRGLYI